MLFRSTRTTTRTRRPNDDNFLFDRRLDKIVIDPEDRNDKIHDHDYVNVYYDYFDDDPATTTPRCRLVPLRSEDSDFDYFGSGTERLLPLHRLRPRRRTRNNYFHDYIYFLHVPKISPSFRCRTRRSPLSTRVHPNPNTYALFSITCHLFL